MSKGFSSMCQMVAVLVFLVNTFALDIPVCENEGTSCDDGKAFTSNDTCIRGVCIGNHPYVDYTFGSGPIVVSSAHGGQIKPEDIPSRHHGCLANDNTCMWVQGCSPQTLDCRALIKADSNTLEIARGVAENITLQTGLEPHLIVNLLHRSRLDANREVDEAAFNNSIAVEAWEAFHYFLKLAQALVQHQYGEGLLIDIHGHTHSENRVELGYEIWSSRLRLSDAQLDTHLSKSTVRSLGENRGVTLSELLRGEFSFGAFYNAADERVVSVPSPEVPYPNKTESYFSGGYIVEQYGSKDSGAVDAIQIELPIPARLPIENTPPTIIAITEATLDFFEHWYPNSSVWL